MYISKKCEVVMCLYAETHYLKKIEKQKSKHFLIMWKAFCFMLGKFEKVLEKDRNNIIIDTENIAICKLDFRSEQNKSAKNSGSRCIVAWHRDIVQVKILLVYMKNDIKGNSETVWWKKQVKENYEEYSEVIGNI